MSYIFEVKSVISYFYSNYISHCIRTKKEKNIKKKYLNVPLMSVLQIVLMRSHLKIPLDRGTNLPHSSKTPSRCIQPLQHTVCCKVFQLAFISVCGRCQHLPRRVLFSFLSAKTFSWLERHLGIGCTHNAKRTGVLPAVSSMHPPPPIPTSVLHGCNLLSLVAL